MTMMPVQLPFGGFTEQNAYSSVPPGMTPQCMNVLPIDPFNRRTRIGQRHGTRTWNKPNPTASTQFLGMFRAYQSGNLVERIIFVRDGKVYHADPSGTGTATAFGNQSTAKLNTTGRVEGTQFGNHFFFVDGTNYVFADLTNPSSATAVQQWGDDSPQHGPYHTDPTSPQNGERATLICRWGARLVLSGYKRTPNLWYACAPDDVYAASGSGGPTDGWTGSTADGFIGAITGTSANEYGTLSDPIVAIFPFGQSGLMFGCTDSFAYMTSDPAFDSSASMVSLSRSVGIVGPRAWCYGQEKTAYFIAKDGMYVIAPNDFGLSRANRISAGRLDSFFLRLDFGAPAIGGNSPLSGGTLRSLQTDAGSATGAPAKTLDSDKNLTDEATDEKIQLPSLGGSSLVSGSSEGTIFTCLCWDADREGVWVFLSVSGAERSSTHLYYDAKTNSFWPQRFRADHCYAPTSAVHKPQSRFGPGRLFMGTEHAVCVMDDGYAVGFDGDEPSEEAGEEEQRANHIRSSLTLGPILAPLPYRAMLSEVRVDLGSDVYSLPTGTTDYSTPVVVTASTGETAQEALGLQVGKAFVVNVNPLVVDGGDAPTVPSTPNYDGGTYLAPTPSVLDGRYAVRPFGTYSQADPFSFGTDRSFNGPGNWTLEWVSGNARWEIRDAANNSEYAQADGDVDPNASTYETSIQVPVSPDVKDDAVVSGAAYATAETTEIGELVAGRNEAIRCRIRAEATYLTIASDGRPWSIERMSVLVSQVGKSRGGS